MDREENTTVNLSFRSFRYITTDAFVRQSHSKPLYQYALDDSPYGQRYSWLETGVMFKIAWREQFYRNGRLRISLGTKAPVFRIQFVQGQDQVFAGKLDYKRIEFRMEHKIAFRRFGTSFFQVHAGYVDGNVPYSRLFNGRANYSPNDRLKVASINAFETMRMNEFISDQYAALFFRHDLGEFFKIKKFSPTFLVAFNTLFGSLKNPEQHHGVVFTQPSKGYYETGLHINNLIRLTTGGYGLAGYYRFGRYAYSDWKSNLTIKLTLSLMM
jgi:hypothetical protein